jgi:phospholipase D1/2
MEQKSGVTFHQAQIALAKQWLGTPDVWVQPTVSIKMPDPTTEGIVIEKTKTKIEEMEYPKTEEEARQIIEKFEAGAIGERLDDPVSDSVAHHALMDKTGLQQEKWLGSEQEELNWWVKFNPLLY